MKLFQQLLLAPAALGLVAPLGAMAADLNMDGVNKYAASSEQVTSITQFSDVQPTDWAYQALSNLVERYGCVAGYPNGTFKGKQAMTRYEAAALLNACLDRVTEITDELRRLMKEFEKELAIVKARVDGLEARVGELEATQFSTTTKLNGVVRFVMGDVYRAGGYSAYGQGSALRRAAALYGHRVYDGSTGGIQNRSVNLIGDPKSQGEAYYYYLGGGAANAQNIAGTTTPAGTSATFNPNITKRQARQLAFSSAWSAFTPGTSNPGVNANGFAGITATPGATVPSGNLAGASTAANGELLVPSIPSKSTSAGAWVTPYQANRIRGSLYTKDGYQTLVRPYGGTSSVTAQSQFLKPGTAVNTPLKGGAISTTDRYGNDTVLRMQTSGSNSSNYDSANILLDTKDMKALVSLANASRQVKQYAFGTPVGTTGSGADRAQNVRVKPAGVADPIVLGTAATRVYTSAANPTGQSGSSGLANGNLSGNGAGYVVAPGGFVTNSFVYNNVINYLMAEYGSLGETQREVNYVQNAAEKFVRNLAAYKNNKNYVADKNAFTFAHDAYLNFDTSFTGKDQLQFRLRTNTIYGFGDRAAFPAARLAYDGSTVAWPGMEKQGVFVDKLFYRFPISNYAVASVGTRLPQDAVLPTRGTYYTKDALLEFFNSSAGVFPSYTGAGAGLSLGQLGNKGFGMKGVSFGIGYLTREADAAAPDTTNAQTLGWFGGDTRFRLPVQLAWQSDDKKWLFSANYAYERGQNSMGEVGTQLALNPFLYANLNESNQFGFTLAYQWDKNFSITGAYGHASVNARYDSSVLGVKMADAGDAAVMNSWMVALNFKDVFLKGNSAGFAIGGVPSVVSNASGWNTDGGMPTALETWYQFQVTDNISVTPGVFYISGTKNSDGIGGGAAWGGVIKSEFKF